MEVNLYNTNKKYNVIYADPPWSYQQWCDKKQGAAKAHYETMKQKDIEELPVERIADKNCILFMWATFPKLQEALATIKAWGFEYKTIGICSPYHAGSEKILKRNIEYAKELTREILLRGDAAITVHLYMTQCLSEENEKERNIGLTAGMDILRRCDGIIVGEKFGISEGMSKEIRCAKDGNMTIEYRD